KPETRSLRPVLAAGVVAAHVELAAAELACHAIPSTTSASGDSENRGNALGKKLSEAIHQRIEWVGRASGHDVTYVDIDRQCNCTLMTESDKSVVRLTLMQQHSAWRVRGLIAPREATQHEEVERDEFAATGPSGFTGP